MGKIYPRVPRPPYQTLHPDGTLDLHFCLDWCDRPLGGCFLFCDDFFQAVLSANNGHSHTRVKCPKYEVDADLLAQFQHRLTYLAKYHGILPTYLRQLRIENGISEPLVECACGCGQLRKALDRAGRPRLYVRGHNNKK